MDQQDWASTSFKELVETEVNMEAKTSLSSSTMVWDSDAHCTWGQSPSHNTSSKVQNQETTAKKPRTKESKPKKVKSTDEKTLTLLRSDEPAKPNCKKKRRKWLKKKDSIPVIGDNTIEGKKKRTASDTSQVTCYNC